MLKFALKKGFYTFFCFFFGNACIFFIINACIIITRQSIVFLLFLLLLKLTILQDLITRPRLFKQINIISFNVISTYFVV
jgi:hypothetical protein